MNELKNKLFRVCPKSGRIVGVRKPEGLLRVFFPIVGLAALIWFLVRVVPKPSRALRKARVDPAMPASHSTKLEASGMATRWQG